MRRLIWVIALLASVWSGWWYLASAGIERGLNLWLDDRRAAGWQAEVSDVSTFGFPFTLGILVKDMRLASPVSGISVAADRVETSTPAWWPGYITLRVPDTPILLSDPTGSLALHITAGQIGMRLHPGTSLQLESLAATAGPWILDTPQGGILAADDFRLAALQDAASEQTYRFSISAGNLTPGSLPRRTLGLPGTWPQAFDSFDADMVVTFDRPLDRTSLEQTPPLPRRIALDRALVAWGDVSLSVGGALTLDDEGVPSGAVTLKARNWPTMLAMSERLGWIAPEALPQTETMLRALANTGDDPDALDLTLTFADGQMSLGSIPLGPAPRLIQQ